MGIAVGIDLGTTNTVVAVVREGKAGTLADEAGRRLIPSIVSFHPNETVLVGASAVERRIIDPENTIFSVKRMIGRNWKSEEVQRSRSRLPFKLAEGPQEATLVETRHETYALPEISAFVLRRAKAVAEAAIGQEVDSAVITVPANFDDLQRASTKMAGKLAGLNVLRILNEPTAAALAYGRGSTQSERIAIYDLGGGTFDITLLDLSAGVFEVLATAGDTALGGDDVDALIVDKMAEHALKTLRMDPRTNMVALAKMRVAAESLKCMLTANEQATIEVPDIARADQGLPLTLKFSYTRAELEAAVAPFVARTIEVTKSAIEAAKLTTAAFDRVILVGGSTRMPLVGRVVENLFGKKPDLRVNPDEVVALGAAIQASALGVKSRVKPAPAPDSVRGGVPQSSRGAGIAALAGALGIPDPNSAKKATLAHGAGAQSAPPPAFARAVIGGDPRTTRQGMADTEISPAQKLPGGPGLKGTLPSAGAANADASAKPRRKFKERPAFVDSRREPDDEQTVPTDDVASASGVVVEPPPASVRRMPVEKPRTETAPMPSLKREELPQAPPMTRADPTLELPDAPRSRKIDPRSEDTQDTPAAPMASIPRGAPALRWSSIPPAFGVSNDEARGSRADVPATPVPPPRKPKLGESFPPVFGSPSDSPAAFTPAATLPALPGPRPAPPPPVFSPFDPPPGQDPLMAALDMPFGGGPSIDAAPADLLIDVTPLSLRVETVGGYSDILIAANSPVPCDRTRVFSTASDSQTQVFIRVAQGEVTAFAKNTFLGELELSGLAPVPRGEAQIAVTFEIDADGILNVRAKDGKTGHETTARMHVIGAQTDESAVASMMTRQNSRTIG